MYFSYSFFFCLLGCANKSYYHSSVPVFESWKTWTGIILLIELLIGLGLSAKISAETFGQNIGTVIGTALSAYGLGFIIFGEWGIRIMEWFFESTIGIVIIVIVNLAGGIVALFSSTVFTWVINGFHWHSPEVAQYVILPALVGGIIQLFILSKVAD